MIRVNKNFVRTARAAVMADREFYVGNVTVTKATKIKNIITVLPRSEAQRRMLVWVGTDHVGVLWPPNEVLDIPIGISAPELADIIDRTFTRRLPS